MGDILKATWFIEKFNKVLGLRVPEDISVIGFDNIEFLEHLDLLLTTVDQNFYEIGRTAGYIMSELINGNKSLKSSYKIPVKLLERGSVSIPSTTK